MINLVAQTSAPTLATASLQKLFLFGGESYTQAGRQGDWMFLFIWWLSVGFFVLLMTLMIWWAFRWRRREGQPAPASPSHNTPLEITWTVIPTIFFVVMFFEGFRGYMNLNYAQAGAIEANLIAFQWSWTLEYPDGQITTETAVKSKGTEATNAEEYFTSKPAPVWYFPENESVLLRMTSRDVIHSFWVPDFRTKMDIFPNRYTSYTFQADPLDDSNPIMQDEELGEYRYRDHILLCAEYCGNDHSEMAGVIRIVPRDIYEAKLEIFGSPRGTLAERGRIVAQQNGCFSCHSVDGSSGTGPTWRNFYNEEHQYADGSTILADANHIRESVYVPAADIRAGYPNQMVSYQGAISTEQMGWLIAYMKTLSDATPESEMAATQVDPDAEEGDGEAGDGEAGEGEAAQDEGAQTGDAGAMMEGTPSGG